MKKFISITISLIILIPNIITVANAQTNPQTFDCSTVQTDTTGFYVILEEPLGGPDANYCFRVCRKVTVEAGQNVAGQEKERICDLKNTCENFTYVDAQNVTKTVNEVTCQRVQILQAKGGLDLLQKYIKLIYLWAAGTIGIVAVLVIVISGFQLMMGEKSGDLEGAKSRISKALIGLVVLFLSGLILYTINPTFFV